MMQEKTTVNFKRDDFENIRPEELIMFIYKNKTALQDNGIVASRIVMPMEYFKMIKLYHLRLGEIQGQFGDYITEDEIFGIPVYIDNIDEIIVE